MKKTAANIIPVSLGSCLLLLLLANNTKAAPSIYFDVNGATTGSGVANGGSYSWESSIWTTVSAGSVATTGFVEGDFARFAAGTDATGSYTITANSDHLIGGLYLVSGTANTVTINGTGVLNIDPTGGPVQGFLVHTGGNLFIDSVLGGTGGLENELSGSLYLYGNNTYSGGTTLGTSAGLNFNNNNSFGTGAITWGVAQQVLADPAATAPITIGNAMVTRAASQLIFVTPTAAPVTFSGGWTLAAGNSTITANNAATKVTISGAISGVGGNLIKTGVGTLVLSSTGNTFNGTTTVSAGILQAGAAHVLLTSSSLILGGGTFNTGGFNQLMGNTTLSMTASSSIDFTAGGSIVDFANSSALPWTGTLDLLNWNPLIDQLRIGTDDTGLTLAQLADIEINGGGLGTARIDGSGFIIVPEPSTTLLGVLGGLGMMGMWIVRRRRTA